MIRAKNKQQRITHTSGRFVRASLAELLDDIEKDLISMALSNLDPQDVPEPQEIEEELKQYLGSKAQRLLRSRDVEQTLNLLLQHSGPQLVQLVATALSNALNISDLADAIHGDMLDQLHESKS